LTGARRVTVVKIGGGISRMPEALERVCVKVGEAAREWPLVIIPGGGPLADGVRELEGRLDLSDDTAHWMAILAMDQFACVLASRIPGAVLVDEPGCIREGLIACRAVVLAPSRWMRSADPLPHSWDVTSDSIAAFVAGALDAQRLILIKPVSSARDAVDPYFSRSLPAGMPCSILGCERIEELTSELSR
jgi:5-(aminomethyl)-3-furanmethanol phosphate kinase